MREAVTDAPVGDDEERRNLVDPEALGQVRMLVHIDRLEHERCVVVASLEHLGDEALDATAAPAHPGVEENETRPCRRALRYGFGSLCHISPFESTADRVVRAALGPRHYDSSYTHLSSSCNPPLGSAPCAGWL
jgi:hypothetical protein